MPTLEIFVETQLGIMAQNNQMRKLNDSCREDGVYVRRSGKKLLSFSCNDYLGLSSHPEVKKAAMEAIGKYGAGGGASRLITGNNPLYIELETAIAKMKGTQAALVFGSGYLANIGVIQALVGKGDVIIADKLIHASLIDGCILSGAKFFRFTHNNIDSCKKLLKKHRNDYKNCLIITETIFSMDGDAAPVDELFNLAENYSAWLVTDDAHGLGIITNSYRKKPHLQMGTLSKAVGSYGGYVCAAQKVINYLVCASRSFIYSTALPPATIAASIAALKIISEDKKLCIKPLENAKLFSSMLDIPDIVSAIVPIIIGDAEKTFNVSTELFDKGFFVASIRPPTVPCGTSRLRLAFSALHKETDIISLANVIKKMNLL